MLSSPVGEARHEFTLPFSKDELAALHAWRADAAWPLPHLSPQAAGSRLYQALFAGPVGEAFRRSQDAARRAAQPLRIRLRLDEAPELAILPWELLCDSAGKFLALSEHTPLVRYLSLPDPPFPLAVTPPLRMLVVTASPAEVPALDVEAEWATVNTALAPLIKRGQVQVERLPHASWEEIQQRLRGEDVHILHFVGHGASDGQGEAGLVLVGEEGQPHWIDAAQFGALISDHRALRLVLLNACQGATGTSGSVLAGVAQTLVRQGIPAVVAMQRPITDAQGVAFARQFYKAIAEGRPVDVAMAAGRMAIRKNDNVAWATPVLFMRAEDGHLFRQSNTPASDESRPDADAGEADDDLLQDVPTSQVVDEVAVHEAAVDVDPSHQNNAMYRRISLVIIAALSGLLSNAIASLITLNQTWTIVAVVIAVLLLLGLEIWLTVAEHKAIPLTLPGKWLETKILVRVGALLILAIAAVVLIPRFLPPPRVCAADQPCIVLAAFSPTSERAEAITTDLTNQLQRVIQSTGAQNVVVATTESVTTEAEAKALAERENALLIVWGVVRADEDRTVINFQMADLLGIAESTSIRPYRVEPMQYNPVDGRIECQQCMSLSGEGTRQANIVAYTAVGLTQYVGGQAAAAQQSFAAALSCAGDPLGDAHLSTAQSPCAPGERIKSSPALIYYYLGKSLAMQGSYARGIEVMQMAAQANPQDAAAWIGIGSAYRNWSQLPDAEEAVHALQQAQSVLESLPITTTTTETRYLPHFNTGFVYEVGGDYAAADAAYQRALDRAQAQAGVNVYNILIARGRAQRLAGDFEAAAQTLEQAADLEPDAPWAYLELAFVQWADQKNQSDAERWIDRAAARNPEQPYVYIVRGQLCTAWGDLSCAVAAYEQALSLRVGDGWIYNQLADLYRRKAGNDVNSEDWAQARRYAEFAVEARPDDPWAHGQLGYIYARTSEFDEDAKQYREKAIEQYEESVAHAYSPVSAASSYCSLGFAHQENQNPEQAIVNYRLCADHAQNEQDRIWAEERISNLSTAP